MFYHLPCVQRMWTWSVFLSNGLSATKTFTLTVNKVETEDPGTENPGTENPGTDAPTDN